jgi:ribosomal-protein-alanine N-acetyltransferase
MNGLGRLVRIIPMGIEHLPEVLKIERESQLDPWTRAQFIQELNQPHSYAFVATGPLLVLPQPATMLPPVDQVIGFHCFWCVADELQIANIAVEQKFRHHGIGRLLMKWALDLACGGNARTAVLEVRKSNLPARKLYDSLGFQVTGERPNYYGVLKESALLMSLDIT